MFVCVASRDDRASQSKDMKRVANYRSLEAEMSLAMRGEVAAAMNRSWLARVWYFKDISEEFIIVLSQALKPMTFAPMEVCAAAAAVAAGSRGGEGGLE